MGRGGGVIFAFKEGGLKKKLKTFFRLKKLEMKKGILNIKINNQSYLLQKNYHC